MTGAPGWIVFDYGEVLCRRTTALPELAARYGVPAAEFEPHYWSLRDAYDLGSSDLEYWGSIGDALGVPVDPALAGALTMLDQAGWSVPDPAAHELLAELDRAGVPLALLSNAASSLGRFAERQPWARHFRHLLFSGDLRLMKPGPEIFHELLDRLGAEPGDCLFLDDRQSNVDGARAVGLRAHRWTGAADARTLLADPLNRPAGQSPSAG